MSRKWLTFWAFALAIAATLVGWSHTLIYYEVQPIATPLWFPLIVITNARESGMIFLSLLQFPMFATAFSLGIRKWRVRSVIVLLLATYASLAAAALALMPRWHQ